MNWLELSQRVEGLLEDVRDFRDSELELFMEGEESYPKTVEKILTLLEMISDVMDEATE